MTLSDTLNSFADVAAQMAKSFPSPSPVSVAAGLAAVAFKAGAAIAAAGDDPVVEITRMLDRNPQVNKVRGEWSAFIDAHWPVSQRRTERSPSSGVGSSDDPYEEFEGDR